MQKLKVECGDVLESLLADVGLALSSVEINNMSTGEPVVNLFSPKNQNGVDFTYIKAAPRERYVIVHFP